MRKILFSLLALGSSASFATDYSQFQAFDNQISIGYGMKQDEATSPNLGVNGNQISDGSMVNLEGERLLNNGIWIDLNANMNFNQGEANVANNPVISNYGFNGKVGYAFQVADAHLLLVPYGIAGLNNSGLGVINIVALDNDHTNFLEDASSVLANRYFVTTGAGGRIEYRINDYILVYGDQNMAYNWDQTKYNNGFQAQNTYSYTSTIGAKFNIVKDLQLGVRGFYTNYQPDASATSNSGGPFKLSQAQSSVGALVSVGLTY
ncbi:MAG: hypothetical protein ORN24_00105 [Burkholderiales bacterium]|jgi:hypothetical protein|nr:hypothetical protein [Burkholderiales bacterium]